MGTIIDNLKRPISQLLGGETLTFNLIEDVVIAVDQGGNIPLKADVEELIEHWQRFYNEYSDEQIKDIVEESRQKRARRYTEAAAVREAKRQSGYVYVLKGGGYYKIGKTINLTQRITQIEPRLPFEVELIYSIETDDIDDLEEFLHKAFADKRTNGEWFDLDEDDLKAIEQMR